MKTILSFPMKIYQSNICGEDLAVTFQRFRCSRSSTSWSYRTRYPFPQFIQHKQVKMGAPVKTWISIPCKLTLQLYRDKALEACLLIIEIIQRMLFQSPLATWLDLTSQSYQLVPLTAVKTMLHIWSFQISP